MRQSKNEVNNILIGLTGGIGSGKTTVAEILIEKGFSVIDADKIGKEIMDEPETASEVINCFGEDIVDLNGKIDRRKLRNIVFADESLLKELNKIFHEKIRARINTDIANLKKDGKSVFFLDAPLLIENKLDKMVDEVWIVSCSIESQIERVMKRDGSNRKEAEQIIKRQMPLEEKLKYANRIIENENSINDLKIKVEEELKEVLERNWKKQMKGNFNE
jgi:dephospho-CoA kinase